MARLIGPAQAERIFLYSSGSKRGLPVPTGTPVPLYADAQCTVAADVLSIAGGALAAADGIPQTAIGDTMEAGLFQFPDVADPVVYTRVAGGPVVALHPDADALIDNLRTRLVALEPGGDDEAATAADLTAHAADSTNVHGIPDTSVLETASGAQGKANAAQTAAVGAAAALAIVFGA